MPDRDERGRFLVGCQPGPGRESGYVPEMNEVVRRLALLGLTDDEIAEFYGISVSTLNNWKAAYPGFLDSLNAGRVIADANVATSLYRRAVGMDIFEERLARKANGAQEVTQVRKQLPPDPGAAAMWLGSRQRKRWGNAKGADPDDEPNQLADMTDDELEARLAELEARKREREQG